MNSFELAVAAEARRLAQTGTVALRNVAVEAQRRVLARISARKDAAFEVQRRFEAEAAARRDAMKSSPQYGPALNNVRSDRITTENCPDGPVLNLLSFELSEGVDLSDGATAPGKLFKAAMEYVRTIPGSVEIKLARETQNFCILSLWDSPLSWSSFQKSVGFTRIAPLVTHDIANRSMMLPRLQRSFSSKAARFLWRIEIIFQADLDSNARSRFESQVSAVVGGFSTGACREFASGWIEHNVPYTRFPISEEDIPARTECTYLILYESAEDNDAERDISELRQRIGLVTLSPGVEKKFSISPQMTYQDTHEPPSLKSEPPSLDSVPVQSQAGTLAGALQRGIRRSTRNEQMEVVTAQLTEYKCYPTDPYTLSQAQHLYMRSSIYTALWRLGTGPNRDLVLPEPYVVDITWLKTRSSLDMIKRRVAKMLNYRIRQLVGYHSGFWVRVADSAQEFAVFTVWVSESVRATARSEYCEILERFGDGSSYLDAAPVQQSVPWQRLEANERVSLGPHEHIEVITFRLPHDAWRRELFEYAFTGFQRVARGFEQSGTPPVACSLIYRGGWSPDHGQARGESDDVFTCFLGWQNAEARVAWYTNLDNSMTAYDNIGRCMDELKMFAEDGIDSRLIIQMNEF